MKTVEELTALQSEIQTGDQGWRMTVNQRYAAIVRKQAVVAKAKAESFARANIPRQGRAAVEILTLQAHQMADLAESIANGSMTIKESFSDTNGYSDARAEEIAELRIRVEQ